MNDIENIKSKLTIEEVVGDYLELKKAGSGLKAICPFHNEKTPSFYVSPDKGIYKCFGCGEAGDIFTFIETYESVDFSTALKKLAEKAGIELTNLGNKKSTKQQEEEATKKEKYFHILEDMTTFWQKKLLENEFAKNYLKKRGLNEKMVRKFRIGFAPDDWQISLNFLKNRNFSEEDIEKVGLIKKNLEKKFSNFYDRFRNRIIFPIFDEQDRPIAFSGRDLSGSDKVAKYLNSPQTLLFDKSSVLYGFNFAKTEARKRGYFILAEGQMDLVMSHQVGFENTVVTSGTSLTEQHLKLLKRFSKNIIFAFDSDQAGLEAAFKGLKKALAANFDVKILNLEKEKDPADIILESPKKWTNIVTNSQNIILFYIKKILTKDIKIKDKIKEMEEKILPFIIEIKNPIEKGNYISKISKGFEVREEYILEALKIVQEQNLKKEKKHKKIIILKNSTLDISAKNTIIIKRKKNILKKLTAIYFWQKNLDISRKWIDEAKVLQTIKQSYNEEIFEKIINLNKEYKNILVLDIEHFYSDKSKENFLFDLEALQENLKKNIIKEKVKKLQENLFTENSETKIKILEKIQKLIKKL